MTRILFIAAAAGLIASQAAAQDSPASPPAPGRDRGGFMTPDLTRQDATQRAQMAFQRLDLNGDGTLTHDEAKQAAAQFMEQRGGGGDGSRIAARIERMFVGASSITLQQYEQDALARFDRADLDHNGVVTAAERQQGRAAARPQ